MGRWSRLLSAPFADYAGVRADARVLDVGAGTGALTAELIARLGPSGVCAVEPSTSFVGSLRNRFPEIEVHEAPAEALPFPRSSFDAALAQLVVHFMRDPVAGLAEMARVVKPTGVVAASVWDYGGRQIAHASSGRRPGSWIPISWTNRRAPARAKANSTTCSSAQG